MGNLLLRRLSNAWSWPILSRSNVSAQIIQPNLAFHCGSRRLVRRRHAISHARSSQHRSVHQHCALCRGASDLCRCSFRTARQRSSRPRGTSPRTTYRLRRWLPLCPRTWLSLLVSKHFHRAAFLRRHRRLDHPAHPKQQTDQARQPVSITGRTPETLTMRSVGRCELLVICSRLMGRKTKARR
jgi:hypothetical protein